MDTKYKNAFPFLMLLAGSLLIGFSMGRWLAPLAAWIGPVLIIRYARDHKVGRGYLLVLVAMILAITIGFISIWLAGMPQPMVPFLVIGIGFLFSLPYLADRLLSTRFSGFSSTFVFPLATTSLEFLFIYTNPLGSWGATGFTQYGVLPLMQLASVTGMIGITFLMGWFASVANWAWENRERGGEVLRGVVAFGAILAAVYLFGFLRLNLAPTSENEETIRIAGITAQSLNAVSEFTAGTSDPKEIESFLQSHVEMYLDDTVREARAGAQLVLWPEGAAVVIGSEGEAALVTRAQEVARQHGIYLTLPLWVQYQDITQPYENKLVLIDPSGEVVINHIKYGGAITEGNRLVGDGILQSAATPYGVISGVICYDLDYPAVIRQAGQNDTGLLLVPSKDWFEIDPVHSHMAVFRAIENGTSLIRQTDTGLSIAADPYGRVLAQSDFFGATDPTMVVQVPVNHVATVYSLFGYRLEWLAPIGLIFLIAWAFLARRATN